MPLKFEKLVTILNKSIGKENFLKYPKFAEIFSFLKKLGSLDKDIYCSVGLFPLVL